MSSHEKSSRTVILGATIHIRKVWAECKFPTQFFPHGFKYHFESVNCYKIECCGDEDDGLVVLSPYLDCPWVWVEVNEWRHLPRAVRELDDDCGQIKVPFNSCIQILGVSQFKLLDILNEQCSDEVEDALLIEVMARRYTTEEI